MEIFAVILEDRHTDTDVEVFSDSDIAIGYARKMANEFAHGDEVDETLDDNMKEAGWIYHGCYSCEGDSVRVVRKTLNRPGT